MYIPVDGRVIVTAEYTTMIILKEVPQSCPSPIREADQNTLKCSHIRSGRVVHMRFMCHKKCNSVWIYAITIYMHLFYMKVF